MVNEEPANNDSTKSPTQYCLRTASALKMSKQPKLISFLNRSYSNQKIDVQQPQSSPSNGKFLFQQKPICLKLSLKSFCMMKIKPTRNKSGATNTQNQSNKCTPSLHERNPSAAQSSFQIELKKYNNIIMISKKKNRLIGESSSKLKSKETLKFTENDSNSPDLLEIKCGGVCRPKSILKEPKQRQIKLAPAISSSLSKKRIVRFTKAEAVTANQHQAKIAEALECNRPSVIL